MGSPAPPEQERDAPIVDAVVLAAGRASRMGRPKHLLEVGGRAMLASVLEAIRGSRVRATVVVLRRGDAQGRELAARLGVEVVEPEAPREGRAASVRAGVRTLPPDGDGVLFALADQPLLESQDFDALIDRFASHGGGIVHAVYEGERGTPVLFASSYREELLGLRGRDGGRVILQRHPSDVVGVPLSAERGRDIDRPEDLGRAR